MPSRPFQRANDFAQSVDESGFHAANVSGTCFVLHSRFAAYDGAVYPSPFLRIGLLVAGGGRYYQETNAGRIESEWRPGELVVIPPGLSGEGRCAAVDMIGFGIDPSQYGYGRSSDYGHHFDAAANRPQRDDVVASILLALRHTAALHGCSSLFFEQGTQLIAERTATLRDVRVVRRQRRLDHMKLAQIRELIEARIGGDLSVTEMAAAVNYEASGFSRAFKLATGVTPFAYFTRRRLERAAEQLRAGQSITNVSLAVGYANTSKFAAAFRRRFGMSPTEWKNLQCF